MMKKIMLLLLASCLLNSNLSYSWNWPWDSYATIWSRMTPAERAQAYRREVIEPIISWQIECTKQEIEKQSKIAFDNSIPNPNGGRGCANDTCDNAVRLMEWFKKTIVFDKAHGVDAYLGLVEWPDYVNREAARDNFSQTESSFRKKYELTNKQFDEFQEQLKQEYPGIERKAKTRAFFSPIEQEQAPLLPRASSGWKNFQQKIGTTWQATTPGTFAGSKFSGGANLFEKLKQWWQNKSSQDSLHQQLSKSFAQMAQKKAQQVEQHYKQSEPTSFGEAKIRGGGQMFQKLRERWQNRNR